MKLDITLRPSRIAIAAISTACALAIAAAWSAVLAPWLQWLLTAIVVACGAHAINAQALRRGGRCVARFVLEHDGAMTVFHRNGSELSGRVVAGSTVLPWFVSLAWLEDDPPKGRQWWPRRLALLPDMLEANDFRRLRVIARTLPYGRLKKSADDIIRP